MSILGNEVIRVEDPRMLTEGGKYVSDLAPAGTAWVTFVRSTMAHATIVGVDKTEALAMPGVLAIVTADDVAVNTAPPMMSAPDFGQPSLAQGTVRFAGEAVAAVITETPAQGEDAAEMVFVDLDPLPVVVDPEEALKDEVVLFPSVGTNLSLQIPAAEELDFSDCDVVIKERIYNSRMAASPIEPRVAAAYRDENGRLTCLSAVQGAHPAQAGIAAALGVEASDIRVIVPDVGGGFGAKGGPGPEERMLGALVDVVNRPVTWVETRTENMMAMGHGRAQIQYVTMGGTADGRITHYQLDMVQESGAYADLGTVLPLFTAAMLPGVYDIANRVSSNRSVVTNTAPTIAFRGAGRPEATAAIERAVDIFAAEAGLDPADVRRKNFIAPDAFPYVASPMANYDNGEYEAALDKVLDAAGYAELRAEQAARRERGDTVQLGIGLSTYVEITAPMGAPERGEFGRLELLADGSVLARTGSTPYGQGHVTTWAMIISDRLGIPMDKITVVHGDTDAIDSSAVTGGSRSVQLAGSAMHDASLKLIEAATPLAAQLLEANPDDIVHDSEAGQFHVAGTPAVSVGWDQIASDTTEDLVTDSDFMQMDATFPFGAHVAVAEVDTETGQVRLDRYIAVDDAGTLVNPLIAAGQVHGGIASGVAQALLEEIHYDDDGNLTTSNFADYSVISAAELPSFELVKSETPTPRNPLGAKGIGEAGTIGATPAMQNAVVDALSHIGVRHIDMPTTAEKVWRATNA